MYIIYIFIYLLRDSAESGSARAGCAPCGPWKRRELPNIHACVCVCVCIYIYIERERDLYDIYIYIYIYI